MTCPRCNSLKVIYGSPMGPYNPDTGQMVALFRFDWCLDCKHQWTVDYEKVEKKVPREADRP